MTTRPRLPLLIALACVAGLVAAGCAVPREYASLSINGKVSPSVDGTALPGATGSSAAQAVKSRSIKIDPSTTTITLIEGETVELDLTGSWMASPNVAATPQWVCPALTNATIVKPGTFGAIDIDAWTNAFALSTLSYTVASTTPIVTGPACLFAFAGRKVSVTAPTEVGGDYVLMVVVSSGGVYTKSQAAGTDSPKAGRVGPTPRLFTTNAVIGTSIRVEVEVEAKPVEGLFFTVNPGATAPRREIGRATLDGTTVTPAYVDAGANANSVAVHGDHLYWSTGTSIGRSRLDGTSVEPNFIGGLSDVADIAVTDRYVFWIRTGPTVTIGRADIDGANANPTWFPSPANPNFPSLEYIAANASHVYFATASFGAPGGPYNYIKRVSVTDPTDVTTLNGGVGGAVGDFAVNDTHLYATGAYAGSAGEGIGRMALSTATTVGLSGLIDIFPSGYAAHWGIAVDEQRVYWVSQRFGTSEYFISRANLDGTGVETTWLPVSVVPNALALSSATSAGARSAVAPGRIASASGARATGYEARTSIRLADGALLRDGTPSETNGPLAGAIFGGAYRWSMPARGNGTTRPAGLAAFTRGDYAASASKLALLGGASRQVGIGKAHLLLRGTRAKDLLCLDVVSDGTSQITRILGGRGAGAGLRGTLSGDGFQVPYDALDLVATGTGSSRRYTATQVEPFTNVTTLAASQGRARSLPSACRALIKRLPAPPPAPRPVPVTG